MIINNAQGIWYCLFNWLFCLILLQFLNYPGIKKTKLFPLPVTHPRNKHYPTISKVWHHSTHLISDYIPNIATRIISTTTWCHTKIQINLVWRHNIKSFLRKSSSYDGGQLCGNWRCCQFYIAKNFDVLLSPDAIDVFLSDAVSRGLWHFFGKVFSSILKTQAFRKWVTTTPEEFFRTMLLFFYCSNIVFHSV